MTIVSDDPALWPLISSDRLSSYCVAAGSTAVVYNWALTFGQEFELILSQRWSLMTVLFICVRYIGILLSVINFLLNLPILSTDAGCTIVWYIQAWIPAITNTMLDMIMIARIIAMYQESKKLLVFLVVVLLTSTITSVVFIVTRSMGISTQEAVLSGYHTCITETDVQTINLSYESVIFPAVWEILVLFLAVRIIIKNFLELRQSPTGSSIGNCFTMLVKGHAFHFLAFAAAACVTLGSLSPTITTSSSIEIAMYSGIWSIQMIQMFVLGPHLILGVREYYAGLVVREGEGTGMMSIAFRAGGDALISGDALTDGDE